MTHHLRSALAGLFALVVLAPGGAVAGYVQTDLVTSATDPDLINPWGISFSATSPFWVSDNGTGKATIYNSAGAKQGLVVSMPTGSEGITGQVFNGGANFNGNLFLFASENGTIAGWRGALGTTAEQLFSQPDAIYKGLAISAANDKLFAANFHAGTIDVFNSSGFVNSFADPTAPAGYAPFNIQKIGGKFFVTFAKQDADKEDDVTGPGFGLVDIFDPVTGNFTRLITGSDAGGTVTALDAPWGLALAPGSFGAFAGALLIGNFGDGVINAFDPSTGTLLGLLADLSNNPLVNPGLWGMTFGNGGNGGDPNALYFTAGGAAEDVGVFGRINAVPEPMSIALLGLSLVGLNALRRRKQI
jgi:uncharacterized protein (TIGR03118 family)